MGSIDVGTTTAMTQDLAVTSPEITSPPPSSRSCCLTMWDYGENGDMYEARGYALLAMGRGVAVMGNGTRSASKDDSSLVYV
ncbi:hypothetical protein ACHAXA_009791 [Cyclostephanos tholiformis]|uniref:Uncharacterized protein n=1 Tax=Cyclostephanos tholiformis TaxID=382380 RepID=A0ABD3RXH4_9STRA